MMSDYHFRETAGADASAPVFIVLHGTGGDEFQFLDLAQHLLPGAHIVSPRGDVSEMGALRFFKRTGEGVYDMADLARRTEKMAGFIAGQKRRHPDSLVLALGYSNGANILASVLFESPDLVDAAVLMHPLIPFSPPAQPGLAGKRILVTAGRRDPICPPAQSEALERYLSAQGAAAELLWHDGGHEIRQEELLRVEMFLKPDAVVLA